MDLGTVWYILIVLSWATFLALESFDFGVGMLSRILSKNLNVRQQLLKTIGPVWDANEVWLVVAIGATYAAFADWYAAMLSGLYLPMVLVLMTLAIRGVALEFRYKHDSVVWQKRCDNAVAIASLLTVLCLGVILHHLWRGLPLDAQGQVSGVLRSQFMIDLWSVEAIMTGIMFLGYAITLGAGYLRLKTSSGLRKQLLAWQLISGAVVIACMLLQHSETPAGWIFALCSAITLLAYRKPRLIFTMQQLLLLAWVGYQFSVNYPVLLASTWKAEYAITLTQAVASPIALQVISLGAFFTLPIVFAYQGYVYWVFRKPERLTKLSELE